MCSRMMGIRVARKQLVDVITSLVVFYWAHNPLKGDCEEGWFLLIHIRADYTVKPKLALHAYDAILGATVIGVFLLAVESVSIKHASACLRV